MLVLFMLPVNIFYSTIIYFLEKDEPGTQFTRFFLFLIIHQRDSQHPGGVLVVGRDDDDRRLRRPRTGDCR